jgi:alkylated DNA nucleotide flippase Atl1
MPATAPQMSREQRAAQIWSVLAFAASNRQIIAYGLLAKLIGVPRAALGKLLGPIRRTV